mgnify:CR=1 FL=1
MNNLIKGKTHEWEIVVGLEVHAQVKSNSKLFSSSSTTFGSSPNSQVSLVDAAMPGMLPVINKYCIEQALKSGIGLKAEINQYSVFDRKNYFYADLPQGYQISQYKFPIVGKGTVSIDLKNGTSKDIRIVRLHLEQDAGKSLHDQNPSKTYVDLNRSGVALMEIVSEPDLRSTEEVGLYISKINKGLLAPPAPGGGGVPSASAPPCSPRRSTRGFHVRHIGCHPRGWCVSLFSLSISQTRLALRARRNSLAPMCLGQRHTSKP